jgi:hypothetical protein
MTFEKMVWPSTPPENCPFPISSQIQGVAFTGRYTTYTTADTWYPSWAADGALYSPWTDGQVGSWAVGSFGMLAATAHAKITGDDALDLHILPLGSEFGFPFPYEGRYPCATLVKDDVWYYGTYCLDDTRRGLNWDILGPFVGFRTSSDFGVTWTDTPHSPLSPLFGESAKENEKVKIGKLHIVDFGRNMEHSPDNKAYLLSHGATSSHADLSWGSGDHIYLIRVEPSLETMNDPDAYEFFAGSDASGSPRWTTDFAQIQPLIDWPQGCGCVSAVYNPGLNRYLMFVTNCWPTIANMDTFILESRDLIGPWHLVSYMTSFGPQGYFVNLPSKFISQDGKTGWLWYSANFTDQHDRYDVHLTGDPARIVNWGIPHYYRYHPHRIEPSPPGSRYGLCVQEIEFQV